MNVTPVAGPPRTSKQHRWHHRFPGGDFGAREPECIARDSSGTMSVHGVRTTKEPVALHWQIANGCAGRRGIPNCERLVSPRITLNSVMTRAYDDSPVAASTRVLPPMRAERDPACDRDSNTTFLTGEPALAARRKGGRPMEFRRLEMFAMQSRGYEMMDSAIRYSARLKVRQARTR